MSSSVTLDRSLDFEIGLQPKQVQLWEYWDDSPFTRVGYGGSRGGGKSGAARRCLILRRLKYPLTNGLILRRTYDELKKNHIDPMFKEFPFMRDWWSAEGKALHFPNGSIQYFGYAEHEDDVKRYAGPEFADIVPEEAGLFQEIELQMLEGSNRWTYPEGVDWSHPNFASGPILPKMVYPFMPGGAGHTYLKRIFIDRDYRENENAEAYAFIQAYGWDNVEWARESLKADGLTPKDYYALTDDQRKQYFLTKTNYGRGLAGLKDKALRDAWLSGSWTIHEGTVFPELSAQVHDLDPYLDAMGEVERKEWMKHLKMLAGMDHATTGVTAATQEAVDWAENLFALEEYYETNRTIDIHAQAIIPMLLKYGSQSLPGVGRHLGQQYILIDPSTEAKTLQRAQMTGRYELASVLDEYSRHGIRATPAHRQQISVGIDVLHGLLAIDPLHKHPFTGKMGAPRLFISRKRCPELWREMQDLQKQRNSNGNWEYLGSDHALDTLRYVAMSRPSAAEKAKADISMLPTQDQKLMSSHDAWAKKWAKTESGQWFAGMNRR